MTSAWENAPPFVLGTIGLVVAIAFPKYLDVLPGNRWFWPYGRRASRVGAIAGSSACIVFAISSSDLIPVALQVPLFVALGLLILGAAIHDFVVRPTVAGEDGPALPDRPRRKASNGKRKKRPKRRKRP